MSFKFGKRSLKNLEGVDQRMVDLCDFVLGLNLFDFGITCGYRGEEEQNKSVFEGRSKVSYPNSKHNKWPSLAVDIIIYINGKADDYTNLNAWYMAVGVFRAAAVVKGLEIRCGADWDGDFTTRDQSFHDLPHIELVLDKTGE